MEYNTILVSKIFLRIHIFTAVDPPAQNVSYFHAFAYEHVELFGSLMDILS